ncbi:hypothetical protein [Methylotenera sp.]|uniref:hypothetical protein n=1 Tax=Methylotenera sp. TaxID=2051956 RepID=UPI00273006B7|nr:hypothetical protein [Methylotenera sp.]MDP2072269.1 hypothetical protein [Methylotenera sp.]MDP2231036.1 hypothetical protein [Methylotenera sp.]MDP3005068.1 hypothetical protein [Methylotenera sp.]
MEKTPFQGKRDGRLTTDDFLFIDVNHLKREGLLEATSFFSCEWKRRGKLVDSINVTVKDDHIIIDDQDIFIEWWRCPLGGKRPWFHCPSCNKRCCKLYKANTSFACKTCLNLVFKVWHERPKRRALRRAEKVFQKVKYEFNRKGDKPKWQRWPTFERLEAEAEQALNVISGEEEKLHDKLRKLNPPSSGIY